ncbi:MAG: hypothetical protein ABDH59_05550 [Fervidobacterium sp.]
MEGKKVLNKVILIILFLFSVLTFSQPLAIWVVRDQITLLKE